MKRRIFLKGSLLLALPSYLTAGEVEDKIYAIEWNKGDEQSILLFEYTEKRWIKLRSTFNNSLEKSISWGHNVFLREKSKVDFSKADNIEYYSESNFDSKEVLASDVITFKEQS